MKRVLILTDLSPASREALKIAVSSPDFDPLGCTLGSILDEAPGESNLLIRVDQVIREQARKLCKSLGLAGTRVASWADMQRAIRGGEYELVLLTTASDAGAERGRRTTIPAHFIAEWGVPVKTVSAPEART